MVGKYPRSIKNNLYILSKENIDFEAEQVLKEYFPIGLEEPQEIPVDMIIESMKINLLYRKLSRHKEILGGCIFDRGKLPVYDENGVLSEEVFEANTIIINSDLADDNDIRYGSTSGHELGHYITQGDLYFKNKDQLSLFENSLEDVAIICKRESNDISYIQKEHKKLETKYDWMEWQANYFSSAITVPKKALEICLKPYYDKYKDKYGKCLLNNLEDSELMLLIKRLAETFHVSPILMIYRLKNLNLLQNNDMKEVITLWQ